MYKYYSHALKFHLFGLLMSFWFGAMFILFVKEVYIAGDDKNKTVYITLLTLSNIYPVAYEINQAIRAGIVDYVGDNVSDIIYYSSTIANIIC